MAFPYAPKLRPGSYATFRALVNDTNDGAISPPLEAGDCYRIELAGGIDAAGVTIKAGDIVIFNGTNWIAMTDEEAAAFN